MSNNRCWYQLKLMTRDVIRKDFKFDPKFIGLTRISNPDIIFTDQWLDYMKNINLEIYSVIVFNKLANTKQHHAHDDGVSRVSAINWLLTGHDSQMIWYDRPETKISFQHNNVKFRRTYQTYSINELTEIDRCSNFDLPIIARVDLPHSVNVGITESRLAVSVRTKNNYNWVDTIDNLRSNNLLIER